MVKDGGEMSAAEIGALGGRARAKKLSRVDRKDIARQAAEARWGAPRVPRATHTGEVRIGDKVIPCAVLEDGTRVLTQKGFLEAVGRSGRPAMGRGSAFDKLPPFLALDNLKPFISSELTRSTSPIAFQAVNGGRAWGYRAELLPQVCEVYLRARDEGGLLKAQEKFARACDLLMRGLARVGIVALVDEATGYQDVRDRQALQALLDRFLRKELAAWAKRFPDEFYEHIYRLRNWNWSGRAKNPPQVVAAYTKNFVYERLAPGILSELQARNPANDKGNRRAKHHQWLTDEIGHPALAQHLHAVIVLMRVATSWDQLKAMLDTSLPRKGETLKLPIMSDPATT